mmetsp:Transcript_111137/g.192767  ORF Transcript_111137/g.192767 Transcript_111137/m.192767 type:complete len:329 (+) Transcript_111137:615-1601(+)
MPVLTATPEVPIPGQPSMGSKAGKAEGIIQWKDGGVCADLNVVAIDVFYSRTPTGRPSILGRVPAEGTVEVEVVEVAGLGLPGDQGEAIIEPIEGVPQRNVQRVGWQLAEGRDVDGIHAIHACNHKPFHSLVVLCLPLTDHGPALLPLEQLDEQLTPEPPEAIAAAVQLDLLELEALIHGPHAVAQNVGGVLEPVVGDARRVVEEPHLPCSRIVLQGDDKRMHLVTLFNQWLEHVLLYAAHRPIQRPCLAAEQERNDGLPAIGQPRHLWPDVPRGSNRHWWPFPALFIIGWPEECLLDVPRLLLQPHRIDCSLVPTREVKGSLAEGEG